LNTACVVALIRVYEIECGAAWRVNLPGLRRHLQRPALFGRLGHLVIARLVVGRLEVEGKAEHYKDAKLFPGGSREWSWRETGTEHVPGIQPADVQELLDHGAKVVVLSRGMAECLRVPRETLDFLKEQRIEAHILPTAQAAELHNRLAKEGPVGGLFHTAC
jgi:hypothetical protein